MVTEDRVINLEATLVRFIEHTDLAIAEIRASNARTDRQLLEMQRQADKERSRQQKSWVDFGSGSRPKV